MKIKLIDFGVPEHQRPYRPHGNDAGADVYLPYDCTLQPGEIAKIPLGFGLEIPDGYEHTLDGYGIPVGSAEGESALVLSAYVPQHKGEVDGGAEVPLLYFFTYSVDDIQSLEDYAFIHGQIITFEQLEQYKVYEDDQYVCYEVTDLFYTNLRQHVESIISQRSDIYFDEQVWERVENIYTYYKDRDVLASRFYYNVPVE